MMNKKKPEAFVKNVSGNNILISDYFKVKVVLETNSVLSKIFTV